MAYQDLTTEQKGTLDDWVALLRGTEGELAVLNNHASAVRTGYLGSIGTILGELQDADLIPNSSGLAGAESLTKAEVDTLITYLQATLDVNTELHRQLIAKAAGSINLIG